jgi:uncharacterized RDD family membrane protein YckC
VTRTASSGERPGAGAAPGAEPSEYAGLASRLAALTVDVLILTVANVLGVVLALAGWKIILGSLPTALTALVVAASAVTPAIYFTVAWWVSGRSLGQVLLGIRVTDGKGRPLRLPRALARAVVGLTLAPIWLAGMVGVLGDARRRAWHDRVLGTTVRYR